MGDPMTVLLIVRTKITASSAMKDRESKLTIVFSFMLCHRIMTSLRGNTLACDPLGKFSQYQFPTTGIWNVQIEIETYCLSVYRQRETRS